MAPFMAANYFGGAAMRRIIFMMVVAMIAGCSEREHGGKTETGTKAATDATPAQSSGMGGQWGAGAQTEDEKIIALKQKAESGDAKSQLRLARMYYNGDDMPKDYAKAAEWYQKAAEQGNAMAQYNIGMMYQKGEGVSKNEAKSDEWLKKAAAQGLK